MRRRHFRGERRRGPRRLLQRLFPERQVLVRTDGHASFILFSRRKQIILAALLVLVGAWAIYASVAYVRHDKVLAAKDNQIAHARLSYRSLLDEVAGYQKKFSSIAREMEENHDMMLGLVERNASLQKGLKAVKNELAATEQEKAAVAAEGNRMRGRIKDLEIRLVDLEETELDSIQRLTDSTVAHIDSMEKVIELAGLKADRLLGTDKRLPKGQGGPFIEAIPDDLPANSLKANLAFLDSRLSHLAGLRSVMRKLPLAAPLSSYSITSGFGKRRDPINKKWASHYGVDLGGPFKASVYVPVPGVVTYVGWKGKYGKLIEVDHGAGIKTRYGHLHKILVRKGQKVKFREKIGLVGSTGRSTGAHLHYEVLFNGRNKDPIKFIRAGRHVFQDQ